MDQGLARNLNPSQQYFHEPTLFAGIGSGDSSKTTYIDLNASPSPSSFKSQEGTTTTTISCTKKNLYTGEWKKKEKKEKDESTFFCEQDEDDSFFAEAEVLIPREQKMKQDKKKKKKEKMAVKKLKEKKIERRRRNEQSDGTEDSPVRLQEERDFIFGGEEREGWRSTRNRHGHSNFFRSCSMPSLWQRTGSEDVKSKSIPSFLGETNVEEEILVLSDEEVVKCSNKIAEIASMKKS